jgi:hypothetical protein
LVRIGPAEFTNPSPQIRITEAKASARYEDSWSETDTGGLEDFNKQGPLTGGEIAFCRRVSKSMVRKQKAKFAFELGPTTFAPGTFNKKKQT